MTNQTRKVKVALEANQSLSVEVPLEGRSGEPLFAKLYLWLLESGKFRKMSLPSCKVYCVLLARADFVHLDCYPSLKRIVADTGLSMPAVTKAIKELVEMSLIAKESGKNKTGNECNIYRIIQPPRQKTDPTERDLVGYSTRFSSLHNDVTDPTQRGLDKQETDKQKPLNKNKTRAAKGRLSKNSSGLLSGKAKTGLYRIGITQKVAATLLKKYEGRVDQIFNAIRNSEALKEAGRLERTQAAYVTGSLLAAWEEESPVTLTKLARRRAEAAAAKAGRLKEHTGRQASIVREQIKQIKAGRL